MLFKLPRKVIRYLRWFVFRKNQEIEIQEIEATDTMGNRGSRTNRADQVSPLRFSVSKEWIMIYTLGSLGTLLLIVLKSKVSSWGFEFNQELAWTSCFYYILFCYLKASSLHLLLILKNGFSNLDETLYFKNWQIKKDAFEMGKSHSIGINSFI